MRELHRGLKNPINHTLSFVHGLGIWARAEEKRESTKDMPICLHIWINITTSLILNFIITLVVFWVSLAPELVNFWEEQIALLNNHPIN